MSDAVKTVTVRRWQHNPKDVVTVELQPAAGHDEWHVLVDGQEIGRVGRYTGTLDRSLHRGSPIRRPGKRRPLWSYTRPGWGRVGEQYTRADAIRALLRINEQEGQQ